MRFIRRIGKGSWNREVREARWGDLECALGVRFKDRSLLHQALVHRSYLNERNADMRTPSYERLEFLGDAFLGWVVTEELYARYPEYTEGDMTRARALLVQGATLAEVAQSIRLGDYLQLGQGEVHSGGRRRPRTLAAALEAIIAAVLLDRGERAARLLVLRLFDARLDGFRAGVAPRDSKSRLQELAQRDGLGLPHYETVSQSDTPGHHGFIARVSIGGRALGEGQGRRKAEAEQAAAAQALRALRALGTAADTE